MTDFKIGDLVYLNKYQRGLLEIMSIDGDYIVVGKHSHVRVLKSMVRHGTIEEVNLHLQLLNDFNKHH